MIGIVGMFVRDVFLHDLEQRLLLRSGQALDHPQIGIFDSGQQRLLSDFVRHLFAALAEPGQSLGVFVITVPERHSLQFDDVTST